MTEQEKKDLTILICEKLLGFKWYVSDSSGRRGLWSPDVKRSWFTKKATGKEALCLGWDVNLPDFFTPNGLQIVKDALRKKEIGVCMELSGYSNDFTQLTWRKSDNYTCCEVSSFGDSEAEALLLAVKQMLESEQWVNTATK